MPKYREEENIILLINKVKNENDNNSFLELVNLYQNACYRVAHSIFFSEDFVFDKDLIILEAAKDFDPEKSKFITHLTNKVRFFLLKKINKHNFQPKLEFRDEITDSDYNENYEPNTENSDNNILHGALKEKISSLDDTTKKIFELRYFSENSLGWREIGKIIGCSGQKALNMHNKFIKQFNKELRKDFPEYCHNNQ